MAYIRISLQGDYLPIHVETQQGNRYLICIDVEKDAQTNEIRVYKDNDDEPWKRISLDEPE